MQISAKQYQAVKLVTVVVLAVIFSQAFIFKNFLIPVGLLIASALVLFYLRRQVKDVIADERDYATGGKAALLTIQIYSWIAVISMFLLYSFSYLNPYYYAVAITLAFSTVILLLLYSVIFRYYNKFKFSDKKFIFTVIIFLIFLAMAILSLRVFSGEDGYMCQDGQWVKHGNPSFSAPDKECK